MGGIRLGPIRGGETPTHATIDIPLTTRVDALQLANLISGLHNVYSSALWLELAAEAQAGIFPEDAPFDDTQTLWVDALQIGTPNRIRLRGPWRPLLAASAALALALEGPAAIGKLNKDLADASKARAETEQIVIEKELLQLQKMQLELKIIDDAATLYLKRRISATALQQKIHYLPFDLKRLQDAQQVVEPSRQVVVSE
jgi:hypothetical protein